MKKLVAITIALVTVSPLAWTQLFFDQDLLYLRFLDPLNDPNFNNKAPVQAFTFEDTFSKNPGTDGPPPVDVNGSLIFYADGFTILNVQQSSAMGIEGRLRQVGLYKPDDGDAELASTAFQMYFDGVEQSPTNEWTLEPSSPGFSPPLTADDTIDPRSTSDYMGFTGPTGPSTQIVPSDEILTFVFWFDPTTYGDFYSFDDVDGLFDDGKPADLVFKWHGLQDEFGNEIPNDSYTALSRLRPYEGVIPVPEPSTYLGASALLIFVAGHFFRSRKRRNGKK